MGSLSRLLADSALISVVLREWNVLGFFLEGGVGRTVEGRQRKKEKKRKKKELEGVASY